MIESGGNMTIDMRAVERLLNESNDYGTAAFNACRKGDIEDAEKLFAKGQELLAAASGLLGVDSVEIWGSGKPRREFMHVDDCADAIVHVLQNYSEEEHVNIGTGADVTIAELAQAIAEIVGYRGEFLFNTAMPDGTPRKLLDVSRLASLGWQPRISLEDGLRSTYAWYRENVDR